ncbi:hypothetical protein PLICRDRAFT_177859 [Plicaturopsis crispa FD-325 SS-3]|nr:hypothetical protein PLICRDRAFT_177859 [Plicaturopsis crispa FD-325 SS-3]
MSRPNRAALAVFLCLVCATVLILFTFIFAPNTFLLSSFPLAWRPQGQLGAHSRTGPDILDIASSIYVVSLPRRTDRRAKMKILGDSLGLNWTYADAIDTEDAVVGRILDHVRAQRASMRTEEGRERRKANKFWPEDIDAFSASSEPLGVHGSDTWSFEMPASEVNEHDATTQGSPVPLTCAAKNDVIPAYKPDLPDFKLLTPAKIAVWHSHIAVIRRIAESEDQTAPSIVLEDDIDMEWDIRARLKSVWGVLPADWDIVFLGYCWSSETKFPALKQQGIRTRSSKTTLRPSASPKCTHAYVLNPRGARRILLHLRHPPFAYSRAIDQALAWLVKMQRLQSYSVVKSVVVQQKVGESDVMGGTGSTWKSRLERGVFGT